ncbi:MAG: hypothetical protein QOI85_928, partial [Chloroflexota bacterium]|nr:hypothetical protein [Chloroflexota bacterium]
MAIRMMGRLAAVLTLGVLMLGTPLTAAAAESSPTTGSEGSPNASAELACDCTTEPTAPGELPPPAVEPAVPGTSAPEAPAAEPPDPGTSAPEAPAAEPAVPTPTAPAPDDPLDDPMAGDTSTIGEPSTTLPEGDASTPPPAVDGAVQPEIESPPDAPLPTAPAEPESAATASPETASVALPATSIASASETATTQQLAALWGVHRSPTPMQSGPDTANAGWAAQSVSPEVTPGTVSPAEGTGGPAEPPASDAADASRVSGHTARLRTAGPTALETTSGVEETVTASIAIMAPRGITSTVSV